MARFAQAYAQLWANSGATADELFAIGAEIDAIERAWGNHERKGNKLGRLGVRVANDFGFGFNGLDEAHPQRELIMGIFDFADRERAWRESNANCLYALTPGYIVGAAEHALAIGVTAEELAENPDQLADVVHAAIRGHRLPISITDVKDTICAMTRFGPITDWVLPEEVERLRRLEHGRLLLLLRSRRAVRFLRKLLGTPAALQRLVQQMETPEERALLRTRLLEARKKAA